MFVTGWQKLLLAFFIILIISVPIASYLLSQRQQAINISQTQSDRSVASPTTKTTSISPAEELKQKSQPSTSPSPSSQSDTVITAPVSFGPTLNFKITLEGRPADNQSIRLFVGIAQGNPTSKPKYLLSFTVDVPKTGLFEGLSLAGLDQGSAYTAYLKGPAYIATSSAFIMSPSVTKLNNGEPLTLLVGDLNDDNVVNSADFTIAKNVYGAKKGDNGYNENVDINRDGVINSLDLAFIIKNFGKTGNSGVWISPLSTATSSGSPLFNSPPSGHPSGSSGYWIWVPAN